LEKEKWVSYGWAPRTNGQLVKGKANIRARFVGYRERPHLGGGRRKKKEEGTDANWVKADTRTENFRGKIGHSWGVRGGVSDTAGKEGRGNGGETRQGSKNKRKAHIHRGTQYGAGKTWGPKKTWRKKLG